MIKARGSRQMTENFAQEILNEMNRLQPSPQVHVLIMGDNNLRWFEDDPAHILDIYMNFLSQAKQIPKSHVIISSLLPSIENQENCDPIFLQFDKDLKTILDPKYELLDLSKSLRTKQGKIKEFLYKDEVHLNTEGAEILAKQIFNKVRPLPYEFFQ